MPIPIQEASHEQPVEPANNGSSRREWPARDSSRSLGHMDASEKWDPRLWWTIAILCGALFFGCDGSVEYQHRLADDRLGPGYVGLLAAVDCHRVRPRIRRFSCFLVGGRLICSGADAYSWLHLRFFAVALCAGGYCR